MKISLLALNSNLIDCDDQNRVIDFIKTRLYEIGENISLISYFDNKLETLKNIVFDNYDIIFCIGSNSSIYNYNIKENFARIFNDKLENSNATYSSLNKYCHNNNIVFSMEEEMEVKIPTQAIPLTSDKYYFNGFMYKFNNTYFIYIPQNLDFIEENYYLYIFPLLKDLCSNNAENTQVLKCFGILEKDIRQILADYFNLPDIEVKLICNGLDSSIYLNFKNNIDKRKLQEITSDVCTKLSKFIYATEDVNIYKMAADLLTIYNKKITIVETLTLGNITRELSNINNDILGETYLFANYNHLIKTININRQVLDTYGEYSVNTIYELTNSILETTSSDIVLFILGDFENKNQSFMAVGDINGIHVYKNKAINDSKLIDNLSKTAVFYLIKNLKQNDLQFR